MGLPAVPRLAAQWAPASGREWPALARVRHRLLVLENLAGLALDCPAQCHRFHCRSAKWLGWSCQGTPVHRRFQDCSSPPGWARLCSARRPPFRRRPLLSRRRLRPTGRRRTAQQQSANAIEGEGPRALLASKLDQRGNPSFQPRMANGIGDPPVGLTDPHVKRCHRRRWYLSILGRKCHQRR